MSGHSKWATIRHKKGALDAKRGKVFSKLSKEITTAAKHGGGDPDSNPRLRTVLLAARQANMPKDNIEKAIKKGTGELPGVHYEETALEGYGPGGVAILLDCMTDNKNRTASEIRNMFAKCGGSMSGAGSVAWIFETKGYIQIDKNAVPEEEIYSIAIEAGADDIKTEEKVYEITVTPENFESVKRAIHAKKIPTAAETLTKLPKNVVQVADRSQAKTVLKLMEELEDHDDVQHVYANFDIPDAILEEVGKEA